MIKIKVLFYTKRVFDKYHDDLAYRNVVQKSDLEYYMFRCPEIRLLDDII